MRVRTTLLGVGLAAIMITAVLTLSVTAVSGADIIVNSLNDQLIPGNGQCTLREALNNANSNSDTTGGDCAAGNGPDTIHLPAAPLLLLLTGPDEDANATGDLDILDDVIIDGEGWGQTLVDGQGDDRVFHIVTTGIVVEINDLTVGGGRVPGAVIEYPAILGYGGAGILNEGGQLSLNGSVVYGNTIDNTGGGDGSGAGILNVDGSLTLSDTNVTQNSIDSSYLLSMGGGIGMYAQTADSDLTLINSTVDENNANSSNAIGGGIAVGASQDVTATLVISSSLVSSNEAGFGGGILVSNISNFATVETTIANSLVEFNESESVGGIVVGGINPDRARVLITNSTFNGNASVDFIDEIGGGLGGGLFASMTTLTINGSTFSNNTVDDNEPAGEGKGGGVYIVDSTAVIANSTFSGNEASGIGPGYAGQGGGLTIRALSLDTTATLINSTIVSNTASLGGGGIAVESTTLMAAATVYFQNTLIAHNLVTSAAIENCGLNGKNGYFLTDGNNLENLDTCGLYALTDIVNADPLIGPLQDNGGPTLTHALLDFSPAIDAADYNACILYPVSAIDQRGFPRPIGPRCDIGAYESTAQSTYKFAYLPVTLK